MCLALLSDKYMHLDFMGEYIDVSFANGNLVTEEIYDLFITPRRNEDSITFLCLSPHNLLSAGALSVEVIQTPGESTPTCRNFYLDIYGYRQKYDPEDGRRFTISIPAVSDGEPDVREYDGKVVDATLSLPDLLDGHGPSLDFMETQGTLFELSIPGPLIAGNCYAMRLIVKPTALLHLPSVIPVPTGIPDQPVTRWIQYADVKNPKQCHDRIKDLLATVKGRDDSDDTADLVARIRTVLAEAGPYILPIDRHRIAISLPTNAEIDEDTPVGNCMSIDARFTPAEDDVPTMIPEWVSGRTTYPSDDLESSAQLVWGYLNEWAHQQAKSKEEITTATKVDHKNVSLIVDALVDKGLVRESEPATGLYLANDKTVDEQEEVLLQLASDTPLQSRFQSRGYIIRYSLSYRYISPEVLAKLEAKRQREQKVAENAEHGLHLAKQGLHSSERGIFWAKLAVWLAVGGIVLTLALTLVQILVFFF
jgi:hypothetical protein